MYYYGVYGLPAPADGIWDRMERIYPLAVAQYARLLVTCLAEMYLGSTSPCTPLKFRLFSLPLSHSLRQSEIASPPTVDCAICTLYGLD